MTTSPDEPTPARPTGWRRVADAMASGGYSEIERLGSEPTPAPVPPVEPQPATCVCGSDGWEPHQHCQKAHHGDQCCHCSCSTPPAPVETDTAPDDDLPAEDAEIERYRLTTMCQPCDGDGDCPVCGGEEGGCEACAFTLSCRYCGGSGECPSRAAVSSDDLPAKALDLLARMRAQHHRTGSYAASPLLAEVDALLASEPTRPDHGIIE